MASSNRVRATKFGEALHRRDPPPGGGGSRWKRRERRPRKRMSGLPGLLLLPSPPPTLHKLTNTMAMINVIFISQFIHTYPKTWQLSLFLSLNQAFNPLFSITLILETSTPFLFNDNFLLVCPSTSYIPP